MKCIILAIGKLRINDNILVMSGSRYDIESLEKKKNYIKELR